MPPGMCIYRMKPEICSLLLRRTPHCTCYLSRASNIWQLCDRIPVLSGPPVWGTMRPKIEVWKRSNLWRPAAAKGPEAGLPRAITIIRLPMYTNTTARVHRPKSLSRSVRIIQETQKSFLLDGKSSCSVWHTPAWIIYCLIFKKRYPYYQIALVQMSYILLILQDLS